MTCTRAQWCVLIFVVPYVALAAPESEEDDGAGADGAANNDAIMKRTFDCPKFTCPAGKTPIQKKDYQAWAYACPKPAFDLFSGMGGGSQTMPHNCCMKHELCYQMCGSDSKKCDEEYNACCEGHCGPGNQFCRLSVMLAGNIRDVENNKDECAVYKEAQEESCECVEDKEDTIKTYAGDALESFFKKYNRKKLTDGKLSEESREEILDKWEDQEAEMWVTLFMKYKKKAVTIRKKKDPTREAQAAKRRREMEDDDERDEL